MFASGDAGIRDTVYEAGDVAGGRARPRGVLLARGPLCEGAGDVARVEALFDPSADSVKGAKNEAALGVVVPNEEGVLAAVHVVFAVRVLVRGRMVSRFRRGSDVYFSRTAEVAVVRERGSRQWLKSRSSSAECGQRRGSSSQGRGLGGRGEDHHRPNRKF